MSLGQSELGQASAGDDAVASKSYVSDSELGRSFDVSSCYGALCQSDAVSSIDHISESEDDLVDCSIGVCVERVCVHGVVTGF